MLVSILLVCILSCVCAVPSHNTRSPLKKCGYESCTKPKDGMLNVHIVPHTHDDVGWLKTVDQYYYGYRNDIQKAGVQYILDSVVKELWEDPARRFIYVETAFFAKWWREQPQSVKDKVHTLVAEGRLKFAGGAWSMNDEATTYYQSTIDQFTFGLNFLNQTFGECGRPTVGWQIDPFGHSREFASLLAGMGFDGLFLGRIDYQDKHKRMTDKSMEFIWRGDDNLGKSSDIFTGVLFNTYSPPPGFCFDVLCNDAPIVDDPDSYDYNVDSRITEFLNITHHMSLSYATNNILVTMGEDFQYQEAGMWFKNLDKLIRYTNKRSMEQGLNITLFYSTPDCYLKAVKDANPTLPIKQDDFFPYASDPHSYWSGYFTSRPAIKFLEAEANRYTQMVKQLYVLADLRGGMKVLDNLKSAMGFLQHHDAITGTEKQHVTYDYVRITSKALQDAHQHITSEALRKLITGDNNIKLQFDRCQFNESSCYTSENAEGNLIVTAYNPLAWPVTSSIGVPVVGSHQYEVRSPDGKWRTTDIVPINTALQRVASRKSKATHEVRFVDNIPALGYKAYYLRKVTRHKRDIIFLEKDYSYNTIRNYDRKNSDYNSDAVGSNSGAMGSNIDAMGSNIDAMGSNSEAIGSNSDAIRSFGDERPGLYVSHNEMLADGPMVVERFLDIELRDTEESGVDASAGILKTVLVNDNTIYLKGGCSYYRGFKGNNMVYSNRSSGAYIFRPEYQTPVDLLIYNTTAINGDSFMETRLSLYGDADFAFRTYKDPNIRYGELDWIVGPITDVDGIGKEYVFKYASNMITNQEFYTDSNGRQVLKRKLNERPQWNLTLDEPVAGNFYPIVDYVSLYDNFNKFSLGILTDRPEGAASLQDGVLEIMLHRRLLHDDAFGVGEALNETEGGKGLVVKGTQRVFFESENLTFKDVLEMRNRLQVFVSDASNIDVDTFNTLTTEKSFLVDFLPDGVHLLTLEPWGHNKLLIRFENYLETEKSTKTVDLDKIFKGFKINSVKETLLSADKYVDTYDKWTWNTKEEFAADINKQFGSSDVTPRAVDRVKLPDNGNKINLNAKEIRTFVVEYEIMK